MRPLLRIALLLFVAVGVRAHAAPPPRASSSESQQPALATVLRDLFSRDTRVRERAEALVEPEEGEPISANTAEEARAVLNALSAKPPPALAKLRFGPKYYLLQLIQGPGDDAAAEVFFEEGTAAVIRAYPGLSADEKTHALLTLVSLDTREGLTFIVERMVDPRAPQKFAPGILSRIDSDSEHLDVLFPALNRALALDDVRAVAVIDLANRLVANERLERHPAGDQHDLFARWIRIHGEDELGRAVSACYALAFIPGRRSTQLLEEARRHPDPFVQLEADFARAKLGVKGGAEDLAGRTLDPVLSDRALKYVSELGLDRYLPKEATDPEFRARTQLVASLSSARHYGKAPNVVELWERRNVFWPPTGDERELFLFRYRYEGADAGTARGLAVLGSATSPLFGESVVPEDASARQALVAFCAWELRNSAKVQRTEEDSRALCGRFLRYVTTK